MKYIFFCVAALALSGPTYATETNSLTRAEKGEAKKAEHANTNGLEKSAEGQTKAAERRAAAKARVEAKKAEIAERRAARKAEREAKFAEKKAKREARRAERNTASGTGRESESAR